MTSSQSPANCFAPAPYSHGNPADGVFAGGICDTREHKSRHSRGASADQIEIIESPGLIAERQRRAAAAAEPPKPRRKLLFGLMDENRGTRPDGEHIAALSVPETGGFRSVPDAPADPAALDPYASARHDPSYAKYIKGGPVTAENLYQTFPEPDAEYVEKLGRLYAGIPTKNGERIGALYPKFLNE